MSDDSGFYELPTESRRRLFGEYPETHSYFKSIASFPLSSIKAVFNVICIMVGVGVFGLPKTFAKGGWIMAIILVFQAFVANFTGKELLRCLYMKNHPNSNMKRLSVVAQEDDPYAPLDNGSDKYYSKEEILEEKSEDTNHNADDSHNEVDFTPQWREHRLETYADIGDVAFGVVGRITVHIFQKGTLLSIGVLFLILAGTFLQDASKSFCDYISSQAWVLIAGAIVFIPSVFIKTLNEVSFISLFGAIVMLAAIIVSISVSCAIIWPAADVGYQSFVVIDTLPNAFSAMVLSFGGHSAFPSVQKHMKRPGDWTIIMDISFSFLFIAYGFVAVCGYYTFGDEVQDTILESMTKSGVSSVNVIVAVTKFLVAIHVMAAYPLVFNVVVTEFEDAFRIDSYWKSSFWHRFGARVLLRTTLIATSITIAYFVFDKFFDVMSLIGAVCITMMVFVLPMAFSLKLRWASLSYFRIACSILFALTGLVGGSIGTVLAIKKFIDSP